MTKILTPKKVIQYAETRLFGSNVTPDMVHRIELHNGVLPSALEEIVGPNFDRVTQENSREPIYFKDGVLFIPQYSGFGRRRRYEAMIKAYLEASERDIKFESRELEDEQRKTNIEYDNNAYDFVVGLFVPDEKYEDRRVFEGRDIKDITKIIFGPTKAVGKQAEIVAKGKSEYLDVQIVEIDGQKILNIGYVYADQAGIIIDKMMREYEALARSLDKQLKIDVFMFGRVGGLKDNMYRADLVYPYGIIDEDDIKKGKPRGYLIDNTLKRLVDNGTLLGITGVNLNVATVVDETEELLKEARDKLGCICVEMEAKESVRSIDTARGRYQGILDINFGFVGHVSDLPLQGDTLADEFDSDKGEQRAVKVTTKAIRGQK